MKRRTNRIGVAALTLWGACAPAAADQVLVDETGFDYVIQGQTLTEGDLAVARDGFARGDANLHSATVGNRVEQAPGDRNTAIDGSLQGNAGVISVNQDAGDINNQANLRVFAIGGSVQRVDVSGGLALRDNVLVSGGGARQDLLHDSLSGSVGVVGVNQSAGSLNVQTNALVLAVGAALGADALVVGDAALGRVVAGNVRDGEPDGSRADLITGSFQDFRGIVQVAQSAGDLNVVSNTIAVSVVAAALPVKTP